MHCGGRAGFVILRRLLPAFVVRAGAVPVGIRLGFPVLLLVLVRVLTVFGIRFAAALLLFRDLLICERVSLGPDRVGLLLRRFLRNRLDLDLLRTVVRLAAVAQINDAGLRQILLLEN